MTKLPMTATLPAPLSPVLTAPEPEAVEDGESVPEEAKLEAVLEGEELLVAVEEEVEVGV